MSTPESAAHGPPSQVGEAVASTTFRFDLAATFLSAWTIGVVDTSTYERFGVFTSNQAGNLVLVATSLFSDRPTALLPAESLLGAAVGVVLGNRLGLRFDAHDRMRVLAPLLLATVLLVLTLIIEYADLSATLLIPTASTSLACLAAAMLFLPSVSMWITANTGQFLSAATGLFGPRSASGTWRGLSRTTYLAAILVLGFVLGSLWVGSGLFAEYTALVGVIPAFLAIAAAVRQVRLRHRADSVS